MFQSGFASYAPPFCFRVPGQGACPMVPFAICGLLIMSRHFDNLILAITGIWMSIFGLYLCYIASSVDSLVRVLFVLALVISTARILISCNFVFMFNCVMFGSLPSALFRHFSRVLRSNYNPMYLCLRIIMSVFRIIIIFSVSF